MAKSPSQFTIEVRHELCHGCRACEVACAEHHENSIWPAASRIRVRQFDPGPLDIPILCCQCGNYPCIAACPPKVKALEVNQKTGAVLVNQEKCLGTKCSRCIKACPLKSAMQNHPSTGKAIVCDLCEGQPVCEGVCPTGALALIPASSFDGKHCAYASAEELAKDLSIKLFGNEPA